MVSLRVLEMVALKYIYSSTREGFSGRKIEKNVKHSPLVLFQAFQVAKW